MYKITYLRPPAYHVLMGSNVLAVLMYVTLCLTVMMDQMNWTMSVIHISVLLECGSVMTKENVFLHRNAVMEKMIAMMDLMRIFAGTMCVQMVPQNVLTTNNVLMNL